MLVKPCCIERSSANRHYTVCGSTGLTEIKQTVAPDIERLWVQGGDYFRRRSIASAATPRIASIEGSGTMVTKAGCRSRAPE